MVSSGSLLFSELHQSLELQFWRTMSAPELVPFASSQTDRAFNTSRTYHDPLVGPVCEVSSNTPLNLTFQQLVELREGVNRGGSKKKSKPFTQVRSSDTEGLFESELFIWMSSLRANNQWLLHSIYSV